ncbi:MAG: UDP-N-acetylmuramate--L-alanine ligase [Actinobacteria bacterium]|nr:UDP-N-acetylmuramate--L-alanine ligase [Actinomycetota bacterium]
MSAIATVLTAMGHVVSGSDMSPSPVLDRLRARGLAVSCGHDAANVGDVDMVVMSTAVPSDNPEVVAAEQRGIRVLRRADVLAAICATRPTIAVAGTHGKTTTTALLAMALGEGGVGSSFIVGGEVHGLGGGAAWGADGWFAVEADESDGTFLELAADAVIVTNVEPDHLDHYGSFAALRKAFAMFLAEAPGPRVVCADDPVAAELVAELGTDKPCLTYGTGPSAGYRMVDVELARNGVAFTLEHGSSDGRAKAIGRFHVPLPGLHNARNAAGAAVAALALGASVEAIARSFAGFSGVARRFEPRGEVAGVSFVDDYAHLPTEVAAALATARSGGWRRVVCVFQPHRYTRTAALSGDFASAFGDADQLIVTDIYAAGQRPIPGVSGKLIADAVSAWVHEGGSGPEVLWMPERDDVRRYLTSELRAGDLCLTLGAGDLTTLPDELIEHVERTHDATTEQS